MKIYEQRWLADLDKNINQNISSSNFSTHLLANLMNISLSSLHRKLEQVCNHTPAEYIREKRLQVARELIDSGEPITKVASKVGYSKADYLASLL